MVLPSIEGSKEQSMINASFLIALNFCVDQISVQGRLPGNRAYI